MSAPLSIDRPFAPSLDTGIEIATRDLTHLVHQLEVTLTPSQQSQLHKIRLAAESLGAVRATQAYLR